MSIPKRRFGNKYCTSAWISGSSKKDRLFYSYAPGESYLIENEITRKLIVKKTA